MLVKTTACQTWRVFLERGYLVNQHRRIYKRTCVSVIQASSGCPPGGWRQTTLSLQLQFGSGVIIWHCVLKPPLVICQFVCFIVVLYYKYFIVIVSLANYLAQSFAEFATETFVYHIPRALIIMTVDNISLQPDTQERLRTRPRYKI